MKLSQLSADSGERYRNGQASITNAEGEMQKRPKDLKWHRAVALVLVFSAVCLGCSKIDVVRLSDHSDKTTKGLRYYRPHPYLLVSESKGVEPGKDGKPEKTGATDKTSLEFKVIYLPDFSQEYVVQVQAGWGSVEFKPTLESGWNLTGFDAKVDSKTTELVQAISGLVEKGAKAAVGGAKASATPIRPGIYRFLSDMQPTLPDGKPNADFGKITGIDFDHPVAAFEK